MRIEGINGEKASADVHAELYAELGSSDEGVIRTWTRNVDAISGNCLDLWRCSDGDKRDNVAFVLQAAFAIVPQEWNIKDKYLAALYFRLFCARLGLIAETVVSYYRSCDIVNLRNIIFFFTYDQQASVSFLTSPIRETVGLPDIKFCVNYNPSRRTIDKPYSADFSWRQLFPNCCVPMGYGGDQCESKCTRFDKSGRGVDFVPQDVNKIAAWLQQTWDKVTKERREREEKKRKIIQKQWEEAHQKQQNETESGQQNDSERGIRYVYGKGESSEPPLQFRILLGLGEIVIKWLLAWLLASFMIKSCSR